MIWCNRAQTQSSGAFMTARSVAANPAATRFAKAALPHRRLQGGKVVRAGSRGDIDQDCSSERLDTAG
jgi:hypothetical protein